MDENREVAVTLSEGENEGDEAANFEVSNSAGDEKIFTQADINEAVAEALRQVFADGGISSAAGNTAKVNTTGVPFVKTTPAVLSGVEEAFYRRNPQLQGNQ